MRRCLRCPRIIIACNGFVLARDFVAARDGVIPWSAVREHCGVCVEIIDETYLRNLPQLPVR